MRAIRLKQDAKIGAESFSDRRFVNEGQVSAHARDSTSRIFREDSQFPPQPLRGSGSYLYFPQKVQPCGHFQTPSKRQNQNYEHDLNEKNTVRCERVLTYGTCCCSFVCGLVCWVWESVSQMQMQFILILTYRCQRVWWYDKESQNLVSKESISIFFIIFLFCKPMLLSINWSERVCTYSSTRPLQYAGLHNYITRFKVGWYR